MALAFDAVTAAAVGANGGSFAHIPVGTPRAVLVLIMDELATDNVSTVSYGGVAMTEVAGSPNSKATGETGSVWAYFLGSGIPTGEQTVAFTGSTATVRAVAITYTAADDTEVQATNAEINSDSVANPSATLALSGETCAVAIGFVSGNNATTSNTPFAGWTDRDEVSFGLSTAGCYTYDTVSSVDVTVGWTQGANDAIAIAVAIREAVPVVNSSYFGGRFFAPRFFAPRYFSPEPSAAGASLSALWDIAAAAGASIEAIWSLTYAVGATLNAQWSVSPTVTHVDTALGGTDRGLIVLRYRYERRTITNGFLEDVTRAFAAAGSTLELSNERSEKGGALRTADFAIVPRYAPSLEEVSDHIAVFADILVGGRRGVFETIQLGLFALDWASKSFDLKSEKWRVPASDNTAHLMGDGPDATYVVAAATNYITGTAGAVDILDNLGLAHALPHTARETPVAVEWAPESDWVIILNGLFTAPGFYPQYPDRTGRIRTEPLADLSQRTPDVTYTDHDYLLGDPIRLTTVTREFFNKVVAIRADPKQTPAVAVAVATNDDPDSPVSKVSLGRTIRQTIHRDDAASATALQEIAASILRDEAGLSEQIEIATLADPRRDVREVIRLTHSRHPALDGIWRVNGWRLELRNGGRMKHTLSRARKVQVTLS